MKEETSPGADRKARVSPPEMSNVASESSLGLSRCTPAALIPVATMKPSRHSGPTRAGVELPQPGRATINIIISPPDARRTSVAMIP